MPICLKCNSKFPYKAIVDGKMRNLQNRKFCLECSPFGKHNTSDIRNLIKIPKTPKVPEGTKLCPRCSTIKPIEEFFKVKSRNNSCFCYCKSCVNNATLEKQRLRKKICVEYKGGRCLICGYNKCIGALAFHHLDPSQKDFGISRFKGASFEKLQPELDKCVLLCHNCHCEVHAGLIELPKEEPNYNFQIDDYKKADKKVYFCCDCGEEIFKESMRCRKCAGKLRPSKITWPPIEELLSLLETTSYLALGKQLGVSDNAIRKHLKKNQ